MTKVVQTLTDDSHEHPAEIARRKRQSQKHRAIYEKIAHLKRTYLQQEVSTAELIFAVDLDASALRCKTVLTFIEVDAAKNYLREWRPTSAYQLQPSEDTLIKLLDPTGELAAAGAVTLTAAQCKTLLPTIDHLGKLYCVSQNRQLQKLIWHNEQWELTYALKKEHRIPEFFIQSQTDKLAYHRALLAVPGLYISPELKATYLVSGHETITRECLLALFPAPFSPDQAVLRKLIETSGLQQSNRATTDIVVKPRLVIRTARYKFKGLEQLHADLFFNYNGLLIYENDERRQLYEKETGFGYSRDQQTEQACRQRLYELNFRWSHGTREEKGWKLLPARLDNAVQTLVAEGWTVHAEGKSYQAPIDYKVNIKTAHDWFELEAMVNFGEQSIPMPQILKIHREGKQYIELGDGRFGLLPTEWLINYTVLTELGRDNNGQLICSKAQTAILQALLDNKANISSDQGYKDLLTEFAEISIVNPTPAPPGFRGQLRSYQQDALGWMYSLRKMGLGGILALDMGLGKTPTVLALLQGRQHVKKPSLVVVPRSLIFNWEAEIKKFTSDLNTMTWRGSRRQQYFDRIPDHKIILTTYGTLCRDAELLQTVDFDYCILDESQTIKNSDTSNAKAVCLVKADYRIAMTGTPIENSLTELWSQFEFLNPGLLGVSGALQRMNSTKDYLPENELKSIQQALQVLLFRRTKEAVAKDLPPKSEIILHCEMNHDQQKIYGQLFTYYQEQMARLKEDGEPDQQSSFMLAALLRLRQAACHPGLINANYSSISSAKIDVLFEHLEPITREGHKVLIFSQFTSMLAIIKKRLCTTNIHYSYLDGQTDKRSAVVNGFQDDPDKKVFLISLKAGGVGLNLTAASYVFIMDPWWNPAIEAQAIDRAYRIGQKSHVIAYRLVTRNTVEEKIVRIQQKKQQLAESVIIEHGTTSKISIDLMKSLLQ